MSSINRKTPKLGQHFLVGAWAARKLTQAADISANDTVLEIGPGTGALTRELLTTDAHVIAIEKDPSLHERLRKSFIAEIESGQLTLIENDVRNFNPRNCGLRASGYILAANIPYYITGEIIRTFLSSDTPPRTIALLVQKEVAQRIIAKKESILSLSVKAYGTPQIVAKVARGNFSPPPSVDSAILLISDISKGFFEEVPENLFFNVVRAGFSSKRKLLASNLSSNFGFTKPEIFDVLKTCGIEEKARAEDVTLFQWKCVAQYCRAL